MDANVSLTVNGKKVTMVRELVRVNHLRNCVLCHAPAAPTGETITNEGMEQLKGLTAPIPVPAPVMMAVFPARDVVMEASSCSLGSDAGSCYRVSMFVWAVAANTAGSSAWRPTNRPSTLGCARTAAAVRGPTLPP